MAEHPEPAPEIDTAPAKPEPNVGWEEARGPLDALGCAMGCLGHGSAIALAIIAVVAVVVALALG